MTLSGVPGSAAELVREEVAAAQRLLSTGVVASGFVSASNSKGCFVRVARGVTARVMLKNLAVRGSFSCVCCPCSSWLWW